MIEDDIQKFNEQFAAPLPILNLPSGEQSLKSSGRTVVLGMGGSHLGADLLNSYDAKLGLIVHSDYGLPKRFDLGSPKRSNLDLDLVIASSYSGNTEEVLDGLNQALDGGFKTAVIASGGKLLEIAKEKALPFIQLPSGLQPRMSGGYQVKALAKLLGRQDVLDELSVLAGKLKPSDFEEEGKMLAGKIGDKIPVVYSSNSNFALAYTWKIRFNETAKIPAFYNLFPEMNHNEILQGSTLDREKGRTFIFLLLADQDDSQKIKKRMEIFSKLYKDRNLSVENLSLSGEGRLYRLFSSIILVDWSAYYLAKQQGVDPEAIPLVEEFKHLLT